MLRSVMKTLPRTAFALSAVAALVWAPARAKAGDIQVGSAELAKSLNPVQHAIIRLTNQERQKHGLRPLRENYTLNAAAYNHAYNMARKNRMEHVLDGHNAGDRITAVGYTWQSYGENIAWNYLSAAAVVQGWMNSPGHRKNILNPNVTEIGVWVAKNSRGEPYYCQVFARPR